MTETQPITAEDSANQGDEQAQPEDRAEMRGPAEEEDTAGEEQDEDDEEEDDEDEAGDEDEDEGDEDGEDEEEDEEEDPAEKEARLRQDLAEAEEELGPSDPGILPALADLSAHQLAQGQLMEAEALSRRGLVILEKGEGPDSRRVAVWRHYIYLILNRQKRYEEAEELLRLVLAHYRQTDGRSSPEVARILAELADLQRLKGRPGRARALSRRALRMMARTAGPLDPQAINLLVGEAVLHMQLDDHGQALRLYRRALVRCERVGEGAAAIRERAEDGLHLCLEVLAAEHQEAGRLAEALGLARELIERAPERGYPLAAQIHDDANQVVEAQRVLEAAVKVLPQGGRLWGHLGDLYGRQGLHGDAARAYERALGCPDVDAGRVRYQAGINSQQRESPLLAIEHLAQVRKEDLEEGEEDLYWQARTYRMMLLRQVGRAPEASALAAEVMAELSAGGVEAPGEEVASLLCLGRALLYRNGDRAAAQACAMQAFRREPDSLCLGLLREVASLPLEAGRTRCLRITVNGRRRDPDTGVQVGFSRTYIVVADSLAEGLSFIRPLEEIEGAGPVSLSEWSRLDIAPVGLRGVHSVSDYRDMPEAT